MVKQFVGKHLTVYANVVKPLFDFLASLVMLMLCSPLILLISIVLGLLYGWKEIFFFQERIGHHNKPFLLIKFQTYDSKLGRVRSPFTQFLRKYALDELPQLLLVLRGKLSLVGPRPLLPEYLPLYNSEQLIRHSVKPGLSGWAQVNGRNAISWEARFQYDVYYIKHQSFGLDFRILMLTFFQLFTRKGNATEMNRWQGNAQ